VPGYVRDGNVWKEPQVIYARDAGVWKEVTAGEETMPASTPIGTVIRGGAYAGNVTIGGKVYGLIVGSSDSLARELVWSTFGVTGDPTSTTNGKANTAALTTGVASNRQNYAAEFCASRSDGGYEDWYLPAIAELQTIASNNASLAAPYKLFFSSGAYVGYFSSTQASATDVFTVNSSGAQVSVSKTSAQRVARAVRRVLLA
jgi:hypothetical protein